MTRVPARYLSLSFFAEVDIFGRRFSLWSKLTSAKSALVDIRQSRQALRERGISGEKWRLRGK